MKPKSFEDLYETVDPVNQEELEWEWDETERAFIAHDAAMRRYILTPTQGILETDDSETEELEDLEE